MRRPYILLALAALLAATPLAPAQSGTMSTNPGPRVQPEFSARDLRVMTRVLELSPEGQAALQALYDGYAENLHAEGQKVREAVEMDIERAEVLNDATLLKAAHGKTAAFQKQAEDLRKEFLSDLKSLLTREQDENWPILERELRRIRSIGSGILAGESVDLVRVTEDVFKDAPMPPPVAALLNQYRLEIDRALQTRQAFLDNDGKGFTAALKEDVELATRLWKEAREHRLRVRDVNDRFARQIAAELSPERQAAFEEMIFELSYPMLLRPTRVEAYLADALELTSLSPDQKQQLAEIKTRFERDVHSWTRAAASAWRQFEADVKPRPLADALGETTSDPYNHRFNGSSLPETHPINQARLRRLQLDQATRAAIDRILSPEQRAEVPSRTTGLAKFENWMSWGI